MSEPAEIFFEDSPRKSKQFRILLVDQGDGQGCPVRALLAAEPEFNLLEELHDAKRILACMRRHKPHLVLIDFAGGPDAGFSLLQQLRKDYPFKPVLVLSDEDDRQFALRLLCERANGYLVREDLAASLVPAMQRVLLGGIYITEMIRNRILRDMDAALEAHAAQGGVLQYLRNRVAVCQGCGLDPVQISKFLKMPLPQVTVLLQELEISSAETAPSYAAPDRFVPGAHPAV